MKTRPQQRSDPWLRLTIVWAVVGLGFCTFAIIWFFTRPVQADSMVELKHLVAIQDYTGFFQRAQQVIGNSKPEQALRILKLTWNNRYSRKYPEDLHAVLRNINSQHLHYKPLFSLVASMYLRSDAPKQCMDLYLSTNNPADELYIEAVLSRKDLPLEDALQAFANLVPGRELSPSGIIMRMAEYLDEPLLRAWAASIAASNGNMGQALEWWPPNSAQAELKAQIQSGYLSLMSANFKVPNGNYLALIQERPLDSRAMQLLAEVSLKASKWQEGLSWWQKLIALNQNLEPGANRVESLRYILHNLPDEQAHQLPAYRDLLNYLESYDQKSKGISSLKNLSHEAIVTALWNRFLEEPRDLDTWKLLCWFAIANRDKAGLASLLEKQSLKHGGWYAFFKAYHLINLGQSVAALPYFIEAGHYGISEAFENSAVISSDQGDSNKAKQYRRLRESLDKQLYPFSLKNSVKNTLVEKDIE